MSTVPDLSDGGPPLVLVTGAPGWIGSRLVTLLAVDGRPVRCLVQPGAAAGELESMPNVRCMRGDLTIADSLEAFVSGARGGTLFHCAAVIHPHRAREFEAVNAQGTRN